MSGLVETYAPRGALHAPNRGEAMAWVGRVVGFDGVEIRFADGRSVNIDADEPNAALWRRWAAAALQEGGAVFVARDEGLRVSTLLPSRPVTVLWARPDPATPAHRRVVFQESAGQYTITDRNAVALLDAAVADGSRLLLTVDSHNRAHSVVDVRRVT